ncbi:MAG: DUF4351 domain-containing protein [Dolichospermum sp. WA123]|nr:DUF4351 domain-containing protein [Dolichospermum sp. WA123]
MKPILSRNLTPLPPFPTREWGFQSLSPRRGEVWRGVYLYIKNFSNILLATTELLPLAVLAKVDHPRAILEQVAAKVNIIEDRRQQINVSACVQLLAGIRFDADLINAYFREDIMQESVVYQKIVREGLEQGRRSEIRLIVRQLQRHLGTIDTETQNKIQDLSFLQLEDLGEALLDFKTETDLISWLTENCD